MQNPLQTHPNPPKNHQNQHKLTGENHRNPPEKPPKPTQTHLHLTAQHYAFYDFKWNFTKSYEEMAGQKRKRRTRMDPVQRYDFYDF